MPIVVGGALLLKTRGNEIMKDTIATGGLKFFGTVNASISHEIKNRMAVINEQAGLLKDLVNLAENGRELSLERLMRLSESLKTQVSLTDAIIRNMNRFAHSVDSFQTGTDICELLTLTAALAKRTVDNKGVRIELELPKPSFSLETAPFFLMNLFWQCLEAVIAPGSETQRLVVGCEKNEKGGQIWFIADGGSNLAKESLSASAMQLASTIHAEMAVESKKKMIRIELPDRMMEKRPSLKGA